MGITQTSSNLLKDKTTSVSSMDIYKLKYDFIRDNYSGEGGYAPLCGYSYLNKHRREESSDFQYRRVITVLNNIFNPLINLYLKPIYGADLEITTANVNLQYIMDNSKPIYEAQNALKDYKLYDLTYYYVATDAYIREDNTITVNDKQSPMIENVFPGNVKSVIMDGKKVDEMEWTEYKEYKGIQVPVECSYDSESNMIFKKTLAWIDGENNITLVAGGVRITVFDALLYGILSKTGNTQLKDTPDSFQLANMQRELFNLESLRTEILYLAAFPIITIATDAEIAEISISLNNILKVPSTVSKMPGYIEPILNSIDKIKETIDEKKSFIYKAYTSGLLSDNVKYNSAMSTKIASSSFLSDIKDLYTNYEEIVNTIFESIVEIYDIDTDYTIVFSELDLEVVTDGFKEDVDKLTA